MTMNVMRRPTQQRLAKLPGVRAVRRPVSPDSNEEFDVYYVRTGRKSAHPLVIIPGGPGMASILAYRAFRRRAAAAGLDVIMVEHRGVGMSRHDDSGADLPPEAITINQAVDDIAAVLADAHVDSAIIYGISYGTYLAAVLGVRHPHLVHAMILDGPVLSRHDIALVRDAIRAALLKGDSAETARLAPKVRHLVEIGMMTPSDGQVAATVYGYGGPELLERHLDLLLAGRTLLWRALSKVSYIVTRTVPYRHEPDLVNRIAIRELDYAAEPDGLPLDPAVAMSETLDATDQFEAEPYDLVHELPKFGWPTVVVAGGRDLVTPPAVAERVASLVPGATLLILPTMAHSALDFREPAALQIAAAVSRGDIDALPEKVTELDALAPPLTIRLLWNALDVLARAEHALPRLPVLWRRPLPRWCPVLRRRAINRA
ncbi:alpha/beta hydrolase [Mycobacterium kubicae]|uniref:Alpha/beta fold hydrolase n=1 Tax=Mycobacterium kubicae TaxID=120959 RepID=A0AAX1J814_9MYCO|nr:alpha/beta fold hydrolase [Mycobacterium kubicae]MCV7094812.1 alpha/beta fold hydrolase [Mycobacterium kubicae]ORV97761.1 alpha/beta hydrolase [Mycobacterium kubicae]QNI13142.1 alpha/beta hydrolase [Mycobacterium kubicae]QPI36657.1 alpha/beta fold hydrolase [Mycobacterium kubicae]GFG67371.1 alpha/beta hydrolase [Mycobacterium kubicae]